MIKGIIFDLNRTLYDPDKKQLNGSAIFVLKELKKKKYKMCLVSKGKAGADDVIRVHNLEKYFIEILFSQAKSEDDFVKCLNSMNLKYDEVMVVGDKIKGEISRGNSLGMQTVWFRNGKYKDELPETDLEKPKHTITKLREVLKLI